MYYIAGTEGVVTEDGVSKLDLSRELSAIDGITYWKWTQLKRCVDSMFERQQKQSTLAVNEDALQGTLVFFREGKLDT